MPVTEHYIDIPLNEYDHEPLRRIAAEKKIILGKVTPAKQEDVDALLAMKSDTDDTRSDWFWLRLTDGTLVLGVFPQGETYIDMADRNKV
jgi:hypothetical protein